jgi:hypothetical protein
VRPWQIGMLVCQLLVAPGEALLIWRVLDNSRFGSWCEGLGFRAGWWWETGERAPGR